MKNRKNRLNISVWMAFFIIPLLLFHIGNGEAKEVDWAGINPEFADAAYVNDTLNVLSAMKTTWQHLIKQDMAGLLSQAPKMSFRQGVVRHVTGQ